MSLRWDSSRRLHLLAYADLTRTRESERGHQGSPLQRFNDWPPCPASPHPALAAVEPGRLAWSLERHRPVSLCLTLNLIWTTAASGACDDDLGDDSPHPLKELVLDDLGCSTPNISIWALRRTRQPTQVKNVLRHFLFFSVVGSRDPRRNVPNPRSVAPVRVSLTWRRHKAGITRRSLASSLHWKTVGSKHEQQQHGAERMAAASVPKKAR